MSRKYCRGGRIGSSADGHGARGLCYGLHCVKQPRGHRAKQVVESIGNICARDLRRWGHRGRGTGGRRLGGGSVTMSRGRGNIAQLTLIAQQSISLNNWRGGLEL